MTSSILSSDYFQPQIIDAYLTSTLDAPSFPSQTLRSLSSLTPSSWTLEDRDEDSVVDSFKDLFCCMRGDQVDALTEAIRALSSHLTLSSTTAKTPSSSNPPDDASTALLAQRCLLGYCKILNRSWLEAVVDLDLVRGESHRLSKGGRGEVQQQSNTIYLDALAGLQLASLLLGKRADAARFARWRRAG